MNDNYEKYNEIFLESNFKKFIEEKVLPGLEISPIEYWKGFSSLVSSMMDQNRVLLARRKNMQDKINLLHRENSERTLKLSEYKSFLENIGYKVPEGDPFTIGTENIDDEISQIPGPQLVVPIDNARYAINAANARWGSLYDAVYGTDVMGSNPHLTTYDKSRGIEVVSWVREFLDKTVPLSSGSWKSITKIYESAGNFIAVSNNELVNLLDASQYQANRVEGSATQFLFKSNNLSLIIVVDKEHQIGSVDKAGISDVILESAISVIMDLEDSVATVSVSEKIVAYSNWLGLMKGSLTATISKSGKEFTRQMEPDKQFITSAGQKLELKGRALMLVRNVGHHMTSPLVLDNDGKEVGEGLIDAIVTTLCAMHDLEKINGPRNSTKNSIYIVKPKLHGPEEVDYICKVFSFIEKLLKLPVYTIKLGLMDEERRTSINLKECIRAAKNRIFFINTGFLDRTGDEIHTSMQSGPLIRKGDMKETEWIRVYEANNVKVGLSCGFMGKGQIGKGMWAMPDKMQDMLSQKVSHIEAGANCAWVPSPTAATIHALHYHNIDVSKKQLEISKSILKLETDDFFRIPLIFGKNLSEVLITQELENNAQGILGYVVRWIDQGIGCSKVPDIKNVGLMEDRATCRISSQHIANWLHHGIINEEQVIAVFKKMAIVVDQQNSLDIQYTPMGPKFDGCAFCASLDLVLLGADQPSGYTEPLLYKYRTTRLKELDRLRRS